MCASSAAPNAEVSADPPEPGVPVQVTMRPPLVGHVDVAGRDAGIGRADSRRDRSSATLASDVLVVATVLSSSGSPLPPIHRFVRVAADHGPCSTSSMPRRPPSTRPRRCSSRALAARRQARHPFGGRSGGAAVRARGRPARSASRTLPPDDGVLRAGTDGVVLSIDAPIGSVVVAAGRRSSRSPSDGDVAVRFGLPPASAEACSLRDRPLTVVALAFVESHGSLDVGRRSRGRNSRSRRAPASIDRLDRPHARGTRRGCPAPRCGVNATDRESTKGFVVPRGAVLLSDEGLAAVRWSSDGVRAPSTAIAILAGNAESVCVKADEDLLRGDLVVVAGRSRSRGRHGASEWRAVS